MAGYGAVVSLRQTIDHIEKSSCVSLWPKGMFWHVYSKLERLQRYLNIEYISPCKSRKKVNALDGQIKDAVWRFEDLLESHISGQILSQSKRGAFYFAIDLECLQRDIDLDSFILKLNDLGEEFIYEQKNLLEVEEDEYVPSRYDHFGGMKKVKVVGLDNLLEGVKEYLTQEEVDGKVFSLVGMPGSGKTTLAQKLFEDPAVSTWFDHRVWVTLGRKYELNEIANSILVQMDPEQTINEITQGDVEKNIGEKLRARLEGRRCLLVLDDVWDGEVIDFLETCMPNNDETKVRIFLTTSLNEVAQYLREYGGFGYDIIRSMWALDDEESKELLREKVFGEDDFPPKLEKAAMKIAKNCEGLPLMIVTVADLLSEANKIDDPKFWNEVAENRNSGLMMDTHDQISKVLFPVYDCSPQHLKMLYLYMGAFPQDFDIPASKLRILVACEGFLERKIFSRILEEFAEGVILSYVLSKDNSAYEHDRTFKTCRLHSCWRHLFMKQASENKFLRVINSDAMEESMEGQRRLCLHSNFIFNFKDVYDSVKCDCAPTTRSLLCLGPYHPYSMPLDVGFKLLRVLDALKVRFYDFPVEILELVLLQYLALTCNGELPTSISKLFNLEFLIIHPHVSIESCEAPSNVPVQIWDMQELKHIEILGGKLPNPNSAVSMQKLSTLLGVSADSCTWEVFRKLPDITKLGIQIELKPESGTRSPLRIFSAFAELEKLDTLKCVVVNTDLKYGCVSILNSLWMIQSSLRKLHLSGMGCPWEDMEVIGSMPLLKNLKLRCFAFRGPKWETNCEGFLSLEYLIIEDTDLVQWEPGHGCFPMLNKVSFKHCYKLQELSWPYDARSGTIEMVDCNPKAFACAKKLKPTDEGCRIEVIASFEGEELE